MKEICIKNRCLFRIVTDGKSNSLGWCALKGAIRNKAEAAEFEELSEHFKFFGLCSLKNWPAYKNKGDTRSYGDYCHGWCHPFRYPDKYLPNDNKPRALISNSDFVDNSHIARTFAKSKYAKSKERRKGKIYDFITFSHDHPWVAECKGWDMTRKVVPILCESGMKGLIIGRHKLNELEGCKNLRVIRDPVSQPDFFGLLHQSRSALFCNHIDASPRMLSECMLMNVPILVNDRILGGWKYINNQTGFFFTNESDILVKAERILGSQDLTPKKYYLANYGYDNACRNLCNFLKKLDRKFKKMKRVHLNHTAYLGET